MRENLYLRGVVYTDVRTYQSQSGSLVHVNFQVRGHAGNELKCVTDVIQLGSSA